MIIPWYPMGHRRHRRRSNFSADCGSWDFRRFYYRTISKPGRDGYLRAMEQMHTTKDTTLFVGDQLFTDVWGAKKCGIVTYLTRPIHPKEEIQIVLKRYLEKIVLFFYHRECRRKGK